MSLSLETLRVCRKLVEEVLVEADRMERRHMLNDYEAYLAELDAEIAAKEAEENA